MALLHDEPFSGITRTHPVIAGFAGGQLPYRSGESAKDGRAKRVRLGLFGNPYADAGTNYKTTVMLQRE